ncbi:tyrosine-protein phosphatase non-receptor type 61F isoform X3 [Hyposmocoma kahamanoa]|uniref:tyrosine-protein phosphatase non-receptor type 61F isoform X3 n=1 Tax=Hyposmocoma kahamanoa TaxID=1477025 RepID=UPI000E6D6A98|nr:tyrosine-protein phosphatase non-receptor type 61F isoform X3 [Hyposmocoma kahamanoa]
MKENKLIMSNIEAEYLDIAKRNAWPLVYQKIGRECQSYPYTCIEAKKPQNKQLNRYRDVNPYDRSRIVLERGDCDYINANLVKMERAQRRYILTQGPLSFTVGHFWLMIWEQKSRAILMLNKTIEKNEVKCHWYWPQGTGEQYKLELTAVRLSIEQLEEQNFNYYVTRLFRVEDMDTHESREIIQFHYTTWPDFGVPSSPTAFLDFLKKVQESGTLNPEFGPAVVHCSAGIGRSGTFCLVDSCLVIIEKEGPNSINIQQILLEMRKDRMGLIQTPDQLRFSYQAIIEGMKRLDPSWKEEKSEDNESLYCTVAEAEEEAPPPPPPRAESLTRPPARPLPAIPASASMGNLNYPEAESSSDEGPPTPPARESSSSASSADDEDDDPNEALLSEGSETATELRRRRTRELADRVSAMKRRARDAERWHAFKRSLYKPLLTFGVLLAGILIYTYVKH